MSNHSARRKEGAKSPNSRLKSDDTSANKNASPAHPATKWRRNWAAGREHLWDKTALDSIRGMKDRAEAKYKRNATPISGNKSMTLNYKATASLDSLTHFYSKSRELNKKQILSHLRSSHKTHKKALTLKMMMSKEKEEKEEDKEQKKETAKNMKHLTKLTPNLIRLISKGIYQSVRAIVYSLADPNIRGGDFHSLSDTILLTMVYSHSPRETLNILLNLLNESYKPPPPPATPPSESSDGTNRSPGISRMSQSPRPMVSTSAKGTPPPPLTTPPPRPNRASTVSVTSTDYLSQSSFGIVSEPHSPFSTPPQPRSTPKTATVDDEYDEKAVRGIVEACVEGKKVKIRSYSMFQKQKIKILNLLKKWIRTYPQDFSQSTDGSGNFEMLANALRTYPPLSWNLSDPKAVRIAQSLRKVARAVLATFEKSTTPRLSFLFPTGSKSKDERDRSRSRFNLNYLSRYVSVRDIKCPQPDKVIAAQLVLMALSRLTMSRSRDFVAGGGGIGTGGGQVAISSRMSDWVSTEILALGEMGPRQMLSMLNLWVRIAYECYRLRSFGNVFEIVYGITRHPVQRISSLFQNLTTPASNELKEMKEFMSPTENFRTYRQKIKDLTSNGIPYIPYFGIMTRDIFSLENANPRLTLNVPRYSVRDGDSIETIIHIKRCQDIYRTINQVLRCRHCNLKVVEYTEVLEILRRASTEMVASERQLTEMSEIVRPRGMTSAELEAKNAMESLSIAGF